VPVAGEDVGEDIDPDTPLPTFEVQPAMLAVDLTLMPGESRSCMFFFFLMEHRWIVD
jgi:hypothetical protein